MNLSLSFFNMMEGLFSRVKFSMNSKESFPLTVMFVTPQRNIINTRKNKVIFRHSFADIQPLFKYHTCTTCATCTCTILVPLVLVPHFATSICTTLVSFVYVPYVPLVCHTCATYPCTVLVYLYLYHIVPVPHVSHTCATVSPSHIVRPSYR